jgi:hypothetical protein
MITSGGIDGFSAHRRGSEDNDMGRKMSAGRRYGPGRRRRPLVLATSAFLVAGGLMAMDWTAAVAATERADAALDETRTELAVTEDDLAAVRAAVDASSATLVLELTALGGHQTERDAARGSADAAAARRGMLDEFDPRLAALQDCLTGAAQALNQLSVSDTGVTSTLQAIEAACADAGVTL